MTGKPDLTSIARRLSRAVDRLSFGPPVTHVYNPLRYARRPHEAFLERYGRAGIEALFVGMNPGPYGMAQTGVPFGEVAIVRDWLRIEERVDAPRSQHPKRPIQGFGCTRSEVSGARLWGWARERFGTPEAFFARFFVWNFCPLVFMEESGRNRTPDKLASAERKALFEPCERALREVCQALHPERVIGVGRFATDRARSALTPRDEDRVGTILHPSPASPIANRGWARAAEGQLEELGIALA